MRNSLKLRLLLIGGILILTFVMLSGAAISHALNRYTQQAEQQRLQGIVFSLLAATEVDDTGRPTIDVEALPEPRLRQPDSGLSVYVRSTKEEIVWESISNRDQEGSLTPSPEVGEWLFAETSNPTLSFGFEWQNETLETFRFSMHIEDSQSPLYLQKNVFTQRLWAGLGIAGGLLLLILIALFSWGLSPLARVVSQLEAIKQGTRTNLENDVPQEIQPLTQSINNLLHQQHERQQRYKNAAADLAHSLKTPLAVLKGQIAPNLKEQQEQLNRIDQIVSYQLQRASLNSSNALHQAVPLKPSIERTIGALKKVYAEKRLSFSFVAEEQITLAIDEGDWLELCGNLLDNAAKHAKNNVTAHLYRDETFTTLKITDDGPGFPEPVEALLNRGQRADSLTPGQGIGLAMVRDITHIYQAELSLNQSSNGGAEVIIVFPH